MLEFTVAGFLLLALIFYAVTGGADSGGGMWDLLASGPRAEKQRRAIAKAIGPIWEANHVWLILVVVVLFTAFPRAFAAIMTALYIPVTLMLIGVIFRGSAFIFRKYDSRAENVQNRWSTLFGAASFFTPFVQGVTLGALATGQIRVEHGTLTSGFLAGWLTPFAFLCGVFALGLCSFLAATYMTNDTREQQDVQNDFRLRALCSGAALGPIALAAFLVAKTGAPEIFAGLTQWWALPLIGLTICLALVALASLWWRKFSLARFAAIGTATLVLAGWSLAQFPYLIVPDVTIPNAAAPAITLRLLLIALIAGSAILLPSLYFLFYIFKGDEAAGSESREKV
ncbi:MAG: cytochrome d ubiquinol oxidase subunit II [Chthoniobacterales bacterium]